jgi:hypothetical protein
MAKRKKKSKLRGKGDRDLRRVLQGTFAEKVMGTLEGGAGVGHACRYLKRSILGQGKCEGRGMPRVILRISKDSSWSGVGRVGAGEVRKNQDQIM